MPYFRKARCLELSTIDYISDQINKAWSGVTIRKSFPSPEEYSKITASNLPIVCIRLLDVDTVGKEIGSTELDYTYNIVIDIFAKSDGQRLDLADFITDLLKTNWQYYDYAHNPTNMELVTTTPNGRIHLASILENGRIDFMEVVADIDKYRHIISFLAKKYV